MSKLAASKWLVAAGIAFVVALVIEIRAKQDAANATMSIAKRTAGIPVTVDAAALARTSDDATLFGIFFASIATSCWLVSAIRREPASPLLSSIPALMYGMSWLLIV